MRKLKANFVSKYLWREVQSFGELMANFPMVEDKGDYFVCLLHDGMYPWQCPNVFNSVIETMGHAKGDSDVRVYAFEHSVSIWQPYGKRIWVWKYKKGTVQPPQNTIHGISCVTLNLLLV